MGLDLVEFVMAVEDTFELAIPDDDAIALRTPGELIDYLHARLPASSTDSCLTQRAYYRVRRATCGQLGVSRAAIRPDTDLHPIFGESESPAWTALQKEIGARQWPRIGRSRYLTSLLRPKVQTFGELAEYLVLRAPRVVKSDEPGWSRAEVAQIVDRLIRAELGITTPYTEASSFVKDLRVD